MIDLRHLRGFVAVAEELSFSRGAERLHITQSPLSQTIRRLEQEVGTQLFFRNTHDVRLTSAGSAFLKEAQKALRAADAAPRAALRAAQGSELNLRLGVSGLTTYVDYLGLVRAYTRSSPSVRLVAQGPYNGGELARRLVDGDIDIGLMRVPLGGPGIATKVIARHGIVAVVSDAHALSGRAELSVQDLQGEPLITYPADKGSRAVTLINNLLVQHGVTPKFVEIAPDTPMLLFMAAIGQGIGLAPSSADLLNVPGIRFVPITDFPPIPLRLAWRLGDERSVVTEFVACCEVEEDF